MTWNLKWHRISYDTKSQMAYNIKWHKISNDIKSKMTWYLKWYEILNDMKSQMIWNLKWHETSNDMKSQMLWNLKWHKTSNDMKSQMPWNLKRHEISNDIKSQWHEMLNVTKYKMSWNVKCHEMSNVMKCKMSQHIKCHEKFMMKCQISWNTDARSVTPNRITRRYTLRSVQSSPWRSFLYTGASYQTICTLCHVEKQHRTLWETCVTLETGDHSDEETRKDNHTWDTDYISDNWVQRSQFCDVLCLHLIQIDMLRMEHHRTDW